MPPALLWQPFLDWVLDKNPVFRIGPPGFNRAAGIIVQHLSERSQGLDREKRDTNIPDFLDKFIEAKHADPENVDDVLIISWLMLNLIGGAYTTATTIRNALYFSLKSPLVVCNPHSYSPPFVTGSSD